MNRVLVFMFLSCVVWVPSLALASGPEAKPAIEPQGWTSGGKEAPVTAKDFVPSIGDEEAYIERYTVSMDLDGGGWIGAYFTISNLGLGNGHGAARIKIKLPEREDKGTYTYFKKVSRSDWSYKEDTLDLSIAGMKLKAKDNGEGFTLNFEEPDGSVKVEIDVTNDLPMWQPGRGRIDVADGGYLIYGLLTPRGSLKGRVFIDGKWRDIAGTKSVFADHSSTNVAPFDLGSHFAHFRTYKDDVMVAWRSLKLSDRYGGKTFTWMMVGYKDKIVFSDADAVLKTGDTKHDGSTGYTIPYSVQIEGKQGGKDKVKLILRSQKMWREDLLERYGAAAKLVAGAVSKPYRYEFKSKFAAMLEIGGAKAKVGGKSRYYFDFMNP